MPRFPQKSLSSNENLDNGYEYHLVVWPFNKSPLVLGSVHPPRLSNPLIFVIVVVVDDDDGSIPVRAYAQVSVPSRVGRRREKKKTLM